MMERLMHYVWQHRLWPATARMATVDGQPVEVISQGLPNTGSGPDFSGAVVKIDGQTWAGDVELHVRASDWRRHGHDSDPAYSRVVLHVVGCDDALVKRPGGSDVIPQLVLGCTPAFYSSFESLAAGEPPGGDLPCAATLAELPGLHVSDWLSSLVTERLHERASRLLQQLASSNGDREQLAYAVTARALGFGHNAEPMERLAMDVPVRLLYKHSDSLPMVEALLFGRSGLLDGAEGPYAESLRTNYAFLAKKYGLPLASDGLPGWKLRQMRPANFPHRRIAILAALAVSPRKLHGRLLAATEPDHLRPVFECEPSAWWLTHHTFGPAGEAAGREAPRRLSAESLRLLMINSVVPLRMADALASGRGEEAAAHAVEELEQLPAEHNALTAPFERAGLKALSAADSQALIHLRRSYCQARKCLYCRFGHRMLACRAKGMPLAHGAPAQ